MLRGIQTFELRATRHAFLKFKKRAVAAANMELGCGAAAAAAACARQPKAAALVEEGRLLAVVGKREGAALVRLRPFRSRTRGP